MAKKSSWKSKANTWFNPAAAGSTWLQRGNALSNDVLSIIMGAGLFKEGGRVRGVGQAKRGFGKALRKK